MFMQARERDPKNLKVAVTQGYSRYLAGNAKGALEVLESARAIDPDNPDVSADIGLATILDGRKDEGLRILAQAAKKWPENPWVIKSYNEALWNEEEAAAAGLPKESGALHEKMKTLEGVPAALALIQMAELELHAEPPHAAKAIEYLSRAQERQNELSALRQGVILSLKAKADVILGKPDEARDELRKALKLCPGDESLLYQFAVLLAKNGNNKEALQALKNSLLAAPSEEAVESIRKRAAAEKGFDSLRPDPQFQKLIRPAGEAANK
jgi:predicted Zn-dependent protease